ncbi:YfbM family protein [Dactylosporangium sp. NPDC000244]|uniref:YfbM family protein n=1 Tax=Dactylosporangium sp. NPDC000244 TaxID=3154365 RepID=UPI00331E15BF
MSMIGNYLRITPPELDRARLDPDWAMEYADELEDAEIDEPDSPAGQLAKDRLHRTDKSWDALRWLLERAACPIDVVHGEDEFTEDDWGYGPAFLLTPDRVAEASAFLSALPYDRLIDGVTGAALDAADVYPKAWSEPDALDHLRKYYDDLVRYFAAATATGDAMVVWLS